MLFNFCEAESTELLSVGKLQVYFNNFQCNIVLSWRVTSLTVSCGVLLPALYNSAPVWYKEQEYICCIYRTQTCSVSL